MRPIAKENLIEIIQEQNCDWLQTVLGLAPEWVKQTDSFDNTPLMHAVRTRNMQVVQLVLAATADSCIDNRSKAGYTALMLAALSGSVDIVCALLARGADVNLFSDEGMTAADYVASCRPLSAADRRIFGILRIRMGLPRPAVVKAEPVKRGRAPAAVNAEPVIKQESGESLKLARFGR
jgi:hypothetical protein